MFQRAVLAVVGLVFVVLSEPAAAASPRPTVHVVYAGQRLGSIAKRYNLTIQELCEANNIRRRDPIHPGQRLVVPPRGGAVSKASTKPAPKQDKTPAAASPKAASAKGPSKDSKKDNAKTSADAADAKKVEVDEGDPLQRIHRVRPGDSLSKLALKYRTTVKALSVTNGLRRELIRVGQKLVLPPDPKQAGWMKYARTPRTKGRLDLAVYKSRWRGQARQKDGRVNAAALRAINGLVGGPSADTHVPERLVLTLTRLSDAFGGRTVRILSGYRTTSYFEDSRHKRGAALDLRVEGVPNEAVRDYLRLLPNVGVGYYPNSSFVHLDVRGHSSYWVDYAGPGEAPRKTPRRAAQNIAKVGPAAKKTRAVAPRAIAGAEPTTVSAAPTEASAALVDATPPPGPAALAPTNETSTPAPQDVAQAASQEPVGLVTAKAAPQRATDAVRPSRVGAR